MRVEQVTGALKSTNEWDAWKDVIANAREARHLID